MGIQYGIGFTSRTHKNMEAESDRDFIFLKLTQSLVVKLRHEIEGSIILDATSILIPNDDRAVRIASDIVSAKNAPGQTSKGGRP